MHLRQYNSTNYLDAAQSYLDIGSLDTNPSGIWSHGQSDDPFWMNPGGQQLWRYYDIHQRKQHYFNLEIAVPLAEFSRMPNGETWSIEMQPEHLLSIELLNSDSMGLCSRYHYNLWEDGGIVAYRRWRNLYFQKIWECTFWHRSYWLVHQPAIWCSTTWSTAVTVAQAVHPSTDEWQCNLPGITGKTHHSHGNGYENIVFRYVYKMDSKWCTITKARKNSAESYRPSRYSPASSTALKNHRW